MQPEAAENKRYHPYWGADLGPLPFFKPIIMKERLLKSFLYFHLCVVVLGSGLVNVCNNQVFDGMMLRYSSWTGGGFGYSFFSPNVGNQTVVKTYTLIDGEELKQDAFGTGTNILDCRFSSVLHTFRNHKAYELMSRVVASYIFAKYPNAGPTYISIGEYMPPTMAEYRKFRKGNRFREICNGTYTYK